MREIVMYTKSWCPYCDRAKALLREKGQSWTEIDIEEHAERRTQMIERSGRSTVPQIFIGDRHVGGFDDLADLERIALFLRSRQQFFHYVSVVSFLFYVCYFIYLFLPVIGSRAFFRQVDGYVLPAAIQQLAITDAYPESVQAGVFFQIMKWVYRVFEAPGAAFPTSHVAVALCRVFFSFRYLRRIRWVHLTVAVLLCFSPVYCRYHYAVDVVAGVITALVLVPLGNWLFFHFHKPREETVPS